MTRVDLVLAVLRDLRVAVSLDAPGWERLLRQARRADLLGRVALLLASSYASAITGEVVHVDAGFHVEGMVFH